MIKLKSIEHPKQSPGIEAAEAAAPAILPGSLGTATKEISRVAKKRLAAGKAPSSLTETVIGQDERVRIFDTDLAPWRMICSLAITGPNGGFVGTGWLAGPKTVITAGHCILERFQMGGWASKIAIIAGRDDNEEPYGNVVSTQFSINDKWESDSDPDFDIGCIHLDSPLGNQTGWFGIAAPSASELQGYRANVAGYPADLGGGRYLYHHEKEILRVSDRRIFYDVDTYGGQSGAPVWIHETDGSPPIVVGIHAYGTGGTPSSIPIVANSAPRIISEVQELIRGWIQADA